MRLAQASNVSNMLEKRLSPINNALSPSVTSILIFGKVIFSGRSLERLTVRRLIFSRGVLSVPFTPHVVLFCSVIKTSSCEDLGLLRSFIDTLPVSQSPLVANFRRLCQVFFDVASVYLQERSSTTHGVSTQGGTIEDTSWSQFDHYLGELGFAVGTNDPMSGITQADWFQGNQNILSMLEQDLSFLDEINGHQTV